MISLGLFFELEQALSQPSAPEEALVGLVVRNETELALKGVGVAAALALERID